MPRSPPTGRCWSTPTSGVDKNPGEAVSADAALECHVGHGLGGANDVAVNEISVIAFRLRAP
jgi:hypothetical protein